MDDPLTNWDEFEHAAKLMFNVWEDGRELAWAQQAWRKLSEAGLTDYSTELERTEVCVRLMTLGAIYLDFCYHACDANEDPDFSEWAQALEIQPLQIGRLVGAKHNEEFAEDEPFTDQWESLHLAYLVLTDAERPNLHTVLCQPTATLYTELSETLRAPSAEASGEEWEVTPNHCTAFDFVDGGFQRARDY